MTARYNSGIPSLTNQVINDVPDIQETLEFFYQKFNHLYDNWSSTDYTTDDPPLQGDATAGRVLRAIEVSIQDATAANEIKAVAASLFNGDAFSSTDDIGKGDTKGNFTLNAAGTTLTLEAAGLTGNAVGALMFSVTYNDTAVDVIADVAVTSNDLVISLRDSAGNLKDLTAHVDNGSGRTDIAICYITDD